MSAPDTLADLFLAMAAALELGGFRDAVVGAFARNAWARVRATTDIDFAIELDPAGLQRLLHAAEQLGLVLRQPPVADPEGGPVPILLLFRSRADPGVNVDFLVAQTPFERSAIERRLPVTLLGQTCNVISPEDLLVYKLVAGRPRDLADVEEVARTQRARGTAIDWGYVDRWATEFGVEDRGRALRRRIAG